jgi:hypothetical protein
MNKFVLPEICENGVFLKNAISFIFNDINANFARGTRHNPQKNGVMASFKYEIRCLFCHNRNYGF